jgi:hypothetical protein
VPDYGRLGFPLMRSLKCIYDAGPRVARAAFRLNGTFIEREVMQWLVLRVVTVSPIVSVCWSHDSETNCIVAKDGSRRLNGFPVAAFAQKKTPKETLKVF